MPQIFARNPQVRVSVSAEIRHTKTNKLVRVNLGRIDLAEQRGGPSELLPATGRRREPHLLVRQLFQHRMAKLAHDPSSLKSGLTVGRYLYQCFVHFPATLCADRPQYRYNQLDGCDRHGVRIPQSLNVSQ